MSRKLPEKERALVYDPALAAKLLKRGESPREQSRNRKINEILSVAVAVFASQGLSGFSIRRIAADAGVTLSTLQHYFGNRDNLLVITINSMLVKYVADYVEISRDTGLTPELRLETIIDSLLSAVNDPVVCGFYANMWATAAQDTNVHALMRESYTRYYDVMTSLVSAIRPDLPREKATTLGVAIGAQMDGLLVASIMAPHGLPDWATLTVNAKALCFSNIMKA